MKKAIIEIKTPCKVNLDSVIPDGKGQFCKVCQTSVIDFTHKTPDEIALYLKVKSSEKTCGTFNSWDVKTDRKVDRFISYLQNKKLNFLTILIIGLVVLAGCRVRIRGKIRATGESPRTLNENTKPIESKK